MMSESEALEVLESTAYRRAYSDGIIDIFAGISLIWIGTTWIWLPDYAGLAGILPAIFVASAISIRKSYVENRLGYVRWSAPRRNKERRNLIALFALGVLLFLAGIAAFFVVDRSLVSDDVLDFIGPGLLAWLLAITALVVAFMIEAWRFLAYAVVLAVAGLITAIQEANPGWPLLTAGVVIAMTGLIMLIRFARENPRQESV